MSIKEAIKKKELNKEKNSINEKNPPKDIFINFNETFDTETIDPDEPKVTCSICYNDYPLSQHIISFNQTQHEICRTCFKEYLKTEIIHNKVLYHLLISFPLKISI